MQRTQYFSPCCDFCCELNFAAPFVPFVLQAQVLYHVLIKMAESQNEENIMCLLLPASAHFELYRKN